MSDYDGQDQQIGGRGAGGRARNRRCIVSGEILTEARLLRFVADPDGHVAVDIEAKLPGRGLWVRSDRASIERAVAKRLFSRSAKVSLTAAQDLPEIVENRLTAYMLRLIGLALKAGELRPGFDNVEKALKGDAPPAVLVEASDGASDGARKLQNAALARGVAPFVLGCFSSAELSLALGRTNVIHAALKSGRMAERLIFNAGRMAGFRPIKPWKWAGFTSEATPVAASGEPLSLARVEGTE